MVLQICTTAYHLHICRNIHCALWWCYQVAAYILRKIMGQVSSPMQPHSNFHIFQTRSPRPQNFLALMYVLNQFKSQLEGLINFLRRLIRILWSIIRNTALKSKRIRTETLVLSEFSLRSLIILISAFSVLWYLLKKLKLCYDVIFSQEGIYLHSNYLFKYLTNEWKVEYWRHLGRFLLGMHL